MHIVCKKDNIMPWGSIIVITALNMCMTLIDNAIVIGMIFLFYKPYT